MNSMKHQIIKYSNRSEYDNSTDPIAKTPFSLGEDVVYCRDKNGLISLRSLRANNYECPLCLRKLSTDLTIISTASNPVPGNKTPSPGSKHPQEGSRQSSNASGVLATLGIGGIIIVSLLFCVVGVLFLSFSSSATSNTESPPAQIQSPIQNVDPTPIPSRTPVRPTANSSANNQPSNPQPLKQYAEISCVGIYFVNLRRSPGYSGKDDSVDSIYKIPCGEIVELLGPAENADGLTWWKVSWSGYTGWVADHTGSGKVILDFNP